MANPTGSEIIYALGQTPNGQPAATTEPFTLAQIAALASVDSSPIIETVVSNTTGTTLAAAAIVGGQINRSGPTAAFTDTTDTAANIVSALPAFAVNEQFQIVFKNATIFSQTLAAGAGVTLPGTVLIPGLSESTYFVTIGGTSASPTATFTHVGTQAIHAPVSFTSPVAAFLATVGAGTILAAAIYGGVVSRSGAQSATAFTDTTDIATAIITLLGAGSAVVGQSMYFIYQNTTNAPATITGGTGVTVSGVTVIPANSSAQYLVTYTAAATVTMVGLGVTNSPVLGTFTANGATTVTVANTAFSPGSSVIITLKTVGGTVAGLPHLLTATPGTGFTVSGTASDTSVYNYSILG